MPSPSRRALSVMLVSVASLVPLATASGGSVPVFGQGLFRGTYDRSGDIESMDLEVAEQHGRKLTRLSINALNEAQFQGHGKIAKDLTTFKAKLATNGSRKYRHTLKLTGTLTVGASITFDGTYEMLRPSTTPLTGTFSLSR